MADLEIRVFGQFQVLADGIAVGDQLWGRKKAKVLVKLLAIAPRRTMHREQLSEILWPDADADLTLNNLYKVIHAARRALEPELKQGGLSRFLLTRDLQISLAAGPEVWIDLEDFETLGELGLKTGEPETLRKALDLYRADLLEEDLYADWASVARERTRMLCERVLNRLAEKYEADGDSRSVETLQQLISLSPANEDAHRSLMRIYAAQGQRHLALNQYVLCCEALKRHLDAAPDAATVGLHETLTAGASLPPLQSRAARQIAPPLPETSTVAASVGWRRVPRAILGAFALAAIVAMATWFYMAQSSHPAAKNLRPGVRSLAILPLLTAGGGDEVVSVSDGLTEGLITAMSRLPGIRVMARGTVFVYKGRIDALAIGRELKVDSVLSGRVTAGPETYTVVAELVNVQDGSRTWSRTFNVGANKLNSLQETFVSELIPALGLRVTAAEQELQKRRMTSDPEAYRLYLNGRSAWNKRTVKDYKKSIEFYRRALERDPTYAQPYAGLAESYGLLGFHEGNAGDNLQKARAAAAKAIELEDSLAEAHTALAMIYALYDWNWPQAESEFRRAIDLNYGYSTAHHWYGVHLAAMGRFAESHVELARAREIDPLSPIVTLNTGYPFYYQRQYREALDLYAKALDLNPEFTPAHHDRMIVFEAQGQLGEAAKEAFEVLRSSGQSSLADELKPAYRSGGYRAMLQKWLAAVENPPAGEFIAPMTPASLAVRVGNREKGLYWLRRAVEDRSPAVVYIAVDPLYDGLRSDLRFQNLLRHIGLPTK